MSFSHVLIFFTFAGFVAKEGSNRRDGLHGVPCGHLS